MPTPPRSSLSVRISIAAVSLTLILITLVGGSAYLTINSLLQENIEQALNREADLVEQRMELTLDTLLRDILLLSETTVVSNALLDDSGRNVYLLPLLRSFQGLQNGSFLVSVCDFEGKLVASNHEREALGYRSESWLAQVIAEGDQIANVTHGTRESRLLIATPILFPATGQVEGMLVVEFPLSLLFLARLDLPVDDTAWLLNDTDTLLYKTAPFSNDTPMHQVSRQLRVQAPLDKLGLRLTIGKDRHQVMRPLRQFTLISALIALLLVLAVVIIARLMARRVTLPLISLSEAAERISSGGELKSQVEIEGNDEVAALATAFNAMLRRLRSAQTELEQRVEERTSELHEALDNAQSANRAKSIFLANMSHEIRTPMNAILGFSNLLHQQIREPRQRGQLETIINAGNNLLGIINDILDLTKIEAGHMELLPRPTSLRNLYTELQQIYSLRAEEKHLSLELEIADELPDYMLLDELRLRQILVNLLGNALKFTDHGFIRLSAQAIPHASEERLFDLLLCVEDSGKGITPSAHERIFEIFHQTDEDDTRKHGGTGLGLAISRRLAELMKGSIRVSSEEGKGSRFEVLLRDVARVNLRDEPSHYPRADTTTQTEPKLPPLPPAHVLVVDDVESNRMLVQAMLAESEITLTEAVDGRDALEKIVSQHPDLVLMDLRMPGMDGFQALHQLRLLPGCEKLPVVALTAAAMNTTREQISAAGFAGYLGKPLEQRSLFAELARHLNRADQNDEADTLELPPAPPLDLTPQQLATLPDLLQALRKASDKRHRAHGGEQGFSALVAHGLRLEQLGREHAIEPLSSLGTQIVELAGSSDQDALQHALTQLEQLTNHLQAEVERLLHE